MFRAGEKLQRRGKANLGLVETQYWGGVPPSLSFIEPEPKRKKYAARRAAKFLTQNW